MMKNPMLKITRIAIAIAFSVVICGVTMRSALAEDRGGDRDDQHHDRDAGRGHDRDRGAAQPDYYYAPQANYYYAPEPEYYYAPQPQYAPAPSQGISLFFGLG
jgi:hypothetical protein